MYVFKQVIDNFAETLKIKSIGYHVKVHLVSSRICASLRLGLCKEGHRTTTQPSNSGTLASISINACNKRQTHNNNFDRNFPGLRVSQRLLLNTSTPFLQTFCIVGHSLQFSCPRKCNSYNNQPCHLSLIKSNKCQDSNISS